MRECRMKHECDKTMVIEYIKAQVDKIDTKTDNLLAFKNKALGIIATISLMFTVVFNLIILIFKK